MKFTKAERNTLRENEATIDSYVTMIGWSLPDEFFKAKRQSISDHAEWHGKAGVTGRYIGLCVFYRDVLRGLTGYDYGTPNRKLELRDVVAFDPAGLVALKVGLHMSEKLKQSQSDDAIAACLAIEEVYQANRNRAFAMVTD